MVLRFPNYFMTLVFALSVVVQYNDTNPVRWMFIYGIACLICIFFALKKQYWHLGAIVAAISGIWAMLKIPELTTSGFQHMLDDVHMAQTGVEAAREFLGLLIVFVWVVILTISMYRQRLKSAPPTNV